jgi:hypothetical protein
MPDPAQSRPPAGPRAASHSGRRTLLLVAAVVVAPVVASYTAYYLIPREARTNYGELLTTAPAPELTGARADGRPFALSQLRGKWVLLVTAPGRCDAGCAQALYATRQARTIQGRERERVQRVWLVIDDTAPEPSLLEQHPDLQVARVSREALAGLPGGADRIFLVDPLGNLVLAFPGEPDIGKVAKDIERLLRASRIG